MPRVLLLAGLALAVFALAFARAAVWFGWCPAARDLVLAEGDRQPLDDKTTLALNRFEVLRYPSGKVRQYESTLTTLDREAHRLGSAVVSVNHPLVHDGWWIYQFGWGPDEQTGLTCTQLRCVKDYGLPFAALGGVLLVAGALAFCFTRRRGRAVGDGTPPLPFVSGRGGTRPTKLGRVANIVAALAVVSLPLFIILRAVLRPEPVPTLQSYLMVPHVASYAAAYILLLFAAFGIGRRFVPLGFLLMTLGLVLGAVWGKFAWGGWWQFDPKENWSFATWLAFAFALFAPPGSRRETALLRLGAVLIVITLTWVNFSHLAAGLHSYA